MDKRIILILGIVIAILLVAVVGLTALLMQGNSTNNLTNNSTNNISDNTNTNSNSDNANDVQAQREVCKDCNGVGYYVCNVCGGTGQDPNDPSKPCPGGQYECVDGKHICYPCGGDGYIDDGDPGYMK